MAESRVMKSQEVYDKFGKGSQASLPRPPSMAGSISSKLAGEPEAFQQDMQDRLVRYLVTMVTYPATYLLLAYTAEQQGAPAAVAGLLETRHQLTDFAESRALITFERQCRKPAYTTLVAELVHKYVLLWRSIVLNHIHSPLLRAWLLETWVMRRFRIPPDDPIAIVAYDHLLRSEGLLQLQGPGAPERALAELQADVAPNVQFMKRTLEQRYTLSRNRTMMERLEMILSLVRVWVRAWFHWLRTLARALNYFSSVLGIVSGAVSFTVVPSIVLSVFSAAVAIFALGLTTVADFGEPIIMGALQWTETGTQQVHRVSDREFGYGEIVQGRRLKPATVEELEPFFESQVQQRSTILHRPEVPHLARDPLLLKCYDLGIIDAQGDVYDGAVPGLLAKSPTGPFRRDGFFAYCSRREVRAATILLLRLLAWRRINSAVHGDEATRFVMVTGQRRAGKGSLFARLVSYPQDYAKALAMAKKMPAVDIRPIMGEKAMYAVLFPGLDADDLNTQQLAYDLAAVVTGMAACLVFMARPDTEPQPQDLDILEAALKARRSCLVCIDTSIREPATDEPGAQGEEGLGQPSDRATAAAAAAPVVAVVGGAPGGEVAAVVEVEQAVVDEDTGVVAIEAKVTSLQPGSAANVQQVPPARRAGGNGGGSGSGGGARGGGNARGGRVVGGRSAEVEALRARWLAVLEAKSQELGLNGGGGRFAVMVTEVEDDISERTPGVHKFQQVKEWVLSSAREYERAV